MKTSECQTFDSLVFRSWIPKPPNSVVSSFWLITSSKTARLNSGQVCLLRCTFVQRNISSWLWPVTVLTCPNKLYHQNYLRQFHGQITPGITLDHLNRALSRTIPTTPPCPAPPAHTNSTHFSQALYWKTGPGQNQICKPFLCYKTLYIF